MDIKIGFSKKDITPPAGTELGGYAGHRPCSGVHDPLWCKAVALEQDGERYALLAFDLLCVDEALFDLIAEQLSELGVKREHIIASAIHTHASPRGVVPGQGPLASVNSSSDPKDPAFPDYICGVAAAAKAACFEALGCTEPFVIRSARGALPEVGSNRHTGEPVNAQATAVECRTESGKTLVLYSFPCHPTVMSAANLEVSADFVSEVEELLGADMSVFCNGAAGDVSTRFTRRESSFAECSRFAKITAEQVARLLGEARFKPPTPISGWSGRITLKAREVEDEQAAQLRLDELTAQWQNAQASGADANTVRTLKSYAEGAGLNLQFSRTMKGMSELRLPVSVFSFSGLSFAAIPGELFSTLLPGEPVTVLCYANGYYRYIADKNAYDSGCYEALAAILARGEGERLMAQVTERLRKLG